MAVILKPDKTRIEEGLTIHEKIIPNSARASKYVASWCKQGEPMKPCRSMKPKGICIHNTDDLARVEDDGEQYTRATWPNCNMSGVVVHYYVDDICAWQNLKEDEQGWHAGDGNGPGNTTSIAIEIIMTRAGSAQDKKAEENGALLAAILLKRHGLTVEQMHSHYYYSPTKKNCPLYIRPHWDQFAAKVQSYYDGIGKTNPDTGAGKLWRVQVGAFANKGNAEKYMQQVKAKGFDAFLVSDGRLNRVQVGAFSQRDNAVGMQNKLAAAGITDSIIKEV